GCAPPLQARAPAPGGAAPQHPPQRARPRTQAASVRPRRPAARVDPTAMTRDAVTILLTRGLRGFADGMVSVLLAAHLVRLGFSSFEIGAIVTGTLVGSALLTVLVGLLGHRVDPRRVLLAAAGLMIATGVGFAWFQTFWPLFIVAVLGTLNPSAVDVSVL